jgi:hypothetical protein
MLKKGMRGCGLVSSGSREGPLTVFCEEGNETFLTQKAEDFFTY